VVDVGGFLDGWLYNLYWPSLAVAIFFSGNLHDVNPVIGFLTQVIQTFVMVYLVLAGITTVWFSLRRKEPT